MRVAVVTESFLPTVNGVTTSVRKVLEHLAASGHEAMVIAPAAGAPTEYAGFKVHQVPALAYRRFPVGLPHPDVQRLLAEFAPDVLHVASPFLLGAQGIGAAGRLGVPSVAVYQTDIAEYARRNNLAAASGLAWRMVRWIHQGAALTLAPSSRSVADLTSAGVERVELWGRGVDLAGFHPNTRLLQSAGRLRRRLGPGGEVIVGYVGRVAPEKQLGRLRALAGMRGVRLVIVGDGPGMPALRRELRGMPVSYLGALSGAELSAAYAAFDVFVHTGAAETFGQTLQEAHASGLPVVAPRAGGPIDLVRHGVDGYLFDPGDDGEFRLFVHRLSTDAALRARMGEAGRRAVLGRSWETVCAQLLGHYESVLAPARV